jgi:hypothetical protein
MSRNRPRRAARVSQEHIEFWDVMKRFIRDEVEPLVPQLGTVVGNDGGRIRIRRDGDDEPGTLGIARNKGVRHQAGDRVVTIPTPSGDRAVIAVLSTGDGPAGRRAVSDTEMMDNAVDNRVLAGNSVDTSQLRPSSVVRNHLTPGLIANEHLGGNAVGSSNIQGNAVTREKIGANAVGANELAGGVVGSSHLASGSVTGNKIANGAVGNSELSGGAVTSSKIAEGAVTPAKLDRAYAPANHTHPTQSVSVSYKGKTQSLQTVITDLDQRLKKAGF